MERQQLLMQDEQFGSMPGLPARCGMTLEECVAAVTRHYKALVLKKRLSVTAC